MSQSAELRLQPDSSRYTLGRFLDDVTARHGERTAIRFEGRSTSYRELQVEARRIARGLVGAGVVKGARVGLLMSNRLEWVTSAFAISQLGAVLVPVNTFATPTELDYILRHSDASHLLLQRALLKHAFLDDLLERHPSLGEARPGRARCDALPHLRGAFCLGLDESRGAVRAWSALDDTGADVGDQLISSMGDEVSPADDGILIYTSGTTAHPKGVLHLQRAAVIQSWRFCEHYALTPEDVVWTAQPFFWTAGIAMSLGATLAAGATLVLQETFDAGAGLDSIESEGATTVHAWPHQEKALAEHPSIGSRNLERLRNINFASPLARHAGIEKDEWGTSGSYGLSETFTLASAIPANAPADLRRDTSGRPLPGMQIRVVDPQTGEPVAEGAKGELAVKGLTLMRGYAKVEPELYLDGDGYFRTQDGGSLDSEGYLHWTGRLSNLIKTGGANVSPLEIDGALQKYPGLRVSVTVGVPHPVLGEVVVLCAVPFDDATLNESEIREFLRGKLAVYKVPRRVLFFTESELSYTGNKKIQVAPMREAAHERLRAESAEIDGVRYQRESVEPVDAEHG